MGSVSVSSCRCCMFVSCVHPVAVHNAAFCMTCSLLMLVEDAICNPMSCSEDNYRELLDGQGTLNLEPCVLSWKYNITNLKKWYVYVE